MKLEKEIILITGIHPQIHAIAEYLSYHYEILLLSHIKRHSNIETALHHLQEDYGHKLVSVIYLKPHGVETFMQKVEKFFQFEQLITCSFLSTPQKFKVVNLKFAETYDDEGHSIFLEKQFIKMNEHKFFSRYYPSNYFQFRPLLHLKDLSEGLFQLIEKRETLPNLFTLYLKEDEILSVAEIQNTICDILYTDSNSHFLSHFFKEMRKDSFVKNGHAEPQVSEFLGWEPERKLKENLPKIIEFLGQH